MNQIQPAVKAFRFRDLPVEIQLCVFQLFLPPIAPKPWNRYEEYGSSAEDSRKTAFSIMTLNKSTFKTFASAFYPYRVIEFSDPIMFANDFLPNSTDGCLSNLRYLCCILNEDKAKKNTTPLPTIMKLAEAINEWDELQALGRFELVIFLSSEYRYKLSGLITMPSQDIVWQKVDELVGGRLRGFEHAVRRRRFKRFEVAHEACIVTAGPSRQSEITYMTMTFTKDGSLAWQSFAKV